jgi:alpha-L-rhamnosidase
MRITTAFAAIVAIAAPVFALGAGDLTASQLRCEYRTDPSAVDALRPRLSWVVTSPVRGARQTAYHVLVASSAEVLAADRGDLWDSGPVTSGETLNVVYNGKPLRSRMQCWWKVRVWDGQRRPSPWSAPAVWNMGLLKPSDWKGRWIGCAVDRAVADDPTYLPAPMLRRSFRVASPVRRAVIYVTAAGLYELSINGKRVGRDFFTPGWTEYSKRNYYQAYDVTHLLRPGQENVIGAILGDGWYGLHHGGRGRLALKAQLHIDYRSGRSDTIATDARWRTTDRSPIRMSDIYNGETYDARKAMPGWNLPGFDDRNWKKPVVDFAGQSGSAWKDVTDIVRQAVRDNTLSVVASNDVFGDPIYGVVKMLRVSYRTGLRVQERRATEGQTLTIRGGSSLTILKAEYGADTSSAEVSKAILEAHPGSPVRVTDILKPVSVKEPKPGVFVFDLGQNFSGWARLRVKGPAGTAVTLRFAEMLNPDGTIYTANLRGARCTDRYILRGSGIETWEPRFTFHGFRYVEVTGYPGRPDRQAITGVALNSDCGITGEWASSNPLLNRLYRNIVWGQRSNYLEVPTDCPQRDERLGWSGDAQVFVGTGAYCMDIAPFFTAWMRTYNDTQYPDGGYPNTAPIGHGVSPAWGDAGIICPWTIYTMYGDTRILADHYVGMQRWIEYLRERSTGLLRPSEGYGDWLNVGDDTPKDVIATAFFGHSVELMSRIAAVLGKKSDQVRYSSLFGNIASAFTRAYVTDAPGSPDHGKVKGNSQTAYLLALQFDLLPERLRRPAFEQLLANIEAHQRHLTVGFVGVDLLLPVLSRYGRADLAWQLLTTKDYPSWLYSVTQGATTIWERWDGWRHDRGFQSPSMNSFNHYAFGACGKWMFSDAAGIAADEPSFASIRIKPTAGGGLTWLRARYRSVRGDIATAWRITGRSFTLIVEVPANTTATVYVPARSGTTVMESGRPAARASGVRYVGMAEDRAVFRVGGGRYTFVSAMP